MVLKLIIFTAIDELESNSLWCSWSSRISLSWSENGLLPTKQTNKKKEVEHKIDAIERERERERVRERLTSSFWFSLISSLVV